MSTGPFAVWMVRPHAFGANPETAASNAFQAAAAPPPDLAERARAEFDGFVAALRGAGVRVFVTDDEPVPVTPDAVFPNNWVSTHQDGTVVLYPMLVPSRQREVRPDWVHAMAVSHGRELRRTLDLRSEPGILEGTGSLVLDRPRRLAFACVSPRTDPELARTWARELGYRLQLFHAVDEQGVAIYHTNVMMAVGTTFSVVCAAAVPDPAERAALLQALELEGRPLVQISRAQMADFAGNVLEVRGAGEQPLIAMSSRAWAAFTPEQQGVLAHGAPIVHVPLDTIERYGGGSARCMLAEVYLPPARLVASG